LKFEIRGIGAMNMITTQNISDYLHEQYNTYIKEIQQEFISGVTEGVEEGVPEGVKKGILNGLNDCFDLGFLNIRKYKTRSIQAIFDDFATENQEALANDLVNTKICPTITEQLQELSDKAVHELETHEITADTGIFDLPEVTDLVDENISEMEQCLKQKLPGNLKIPIFFYSLQKETYKCIKANLNTGLNKIRTVLDPSEE
jgi:hypothetical protein